MLDWNEVFAYDPSSFSGLRWKTNRYGAHGRLVKQAGDSAGTERVDGYSGIRLDGEGFVAHRIVWEMHNGPIAEGMTVDHINGVRSDNRIDNLRLVTNGVNVRNKKKYANNTSGYTGVYWDEANQKALARWNDLDGKQRSRTFRAHGGEKDVAINTAKAFRDMKLAALNEAGAGYTERHGNGST